MVWPSGDQTGAVSTSPSALKGTTLVGSLPSERMTHTSRPYGRRSKTPRRNTMCDPVGDTDALQPSSANFRGVPPTTEILQRLGDELVFSIRETNRGAPSGNQLSTW